MPRLLLLREEMRLHFEALLLSDRRQAEEKERVRRLPLRQMRAVHRLVYEGDSSFREGVCQMTLDYFYGAQADQFTFYRIPKALFTEERFRVISAEAKILYGMCKRPNDHQEEVM